MRLFLLLGMPNAVRIVAGIFQQVERLQTEAKLLHEQLQSTQPVMATTDRQALKKKVALEVRSTMHPQDALERDRAYACP